jgi:hypothetical protein
MSKKEKQLSKFIEGIKAWEANSKRLLELNQTCDDDLASFYRNQNTTINSILKEAEYYNLTGK